MRPMPPACQNVETPSRFMPLTTSARMREPTTVPTMPPGRRTATCRRGTPRRSRAAGVPRRCRESAALVRAITTRPANAASAPLSAYTATSVRSHRQAGQARRVRTAADRVDAAAEARGAQHARSSRPSEQRSTTTTGAGTPTDEAGAEHAEPGREAVDHLALHEHVGEPVRDPQHAVGRDERRDAHVRDDHAVHRAAARRRRRARRRSRARRGPTAMTAAPTHAARPRTAPDRQVDTAGQDHQREARPAMRNCSAAWRSTIVRFSNVAKCGLSQAQQRAQIATIAASARDDDEQPRPAARRAARTCSEASARVHRVRRRIESRATAAMITRPTTATCHSVLTPRRLRPLRSTADGGRPDERPDDAAATLLERGAAEDDRGDRVELEAERDRRVRGVHARSHDERRRPR